MALINRVTRLFTADFNAVLDRIEEPELLLKQSVREMEEAIESAEQRIKRLTVEQEQCVSRATQASSVLASIDDELDVCFKANEEALARTLIRRKLETERQLASTRQVGERLASALVEQEAELEGHRQSLDRVRQQACVLMADSSHADSSVAPGATVTVDDVEVAFLREKQRRAEHE